MAQVDSASIVPLYRQVADYVRVRIRNGTYQSGDRLPSEAQLGQELGVSRITVRQALSDLERDGLVYRVPGKGTFAKRAKPLERLTTLTGFGENVIARGLRPGYRVLRVARTTADEEVKRALGQEEGPVLLVERVMLASDQPICLHASCLPLWLVERAPDMFTAAHLGSHSLYATIQQTGVRLLWADEVVDPGLADDFEAVCLDIAPGSLVLRVLRTTYDTFDRPVEHVRQTYRADEYSYRVTLYAGREEGKEDAQLP